MSTTRMTFSYTPTESASANVLACDCVRSGVFTLIALLFNPFIPVYATREVWIPFDTAGFLLFWVAGVKLRASKPAPSNP